jgi:nitrite reductase/ring-hydroxylating ferredoxin subunit
MRPLESVSASLIRRSELPESAPVALEVVIGGETQSIIVELAGNKLRAWLNVCPHQGRRLDYAPGKFLLDGATLVCAAHGAVFRRSDGFCQAGPCRGQSLAAVAVAETADGTLHFGDAAEAMLRTSGSPPPA